MQGKILTKENVEQDVEKRVEWIRSIVNQSNSKGIIIGESGGKDSAVVTALCVKAMGLENVLGVNMPCLSNPDDEKDAYELIKKFPTRMITVDLSETFRVIKNDLTRSLQSLDNPYEELTDTAISNIKPRLRMTTLYALGQSKGYLVAGTDNKSERFMGYFTKWGDGAYDFNPIADLTVKEVYILGEYLGVPGEILYKTPSAGLWKGQTDEDEMGVTYKEIDEYILTGDTNERAKNILNKSYCQTKHKREMPYMYK